MLEGAAREHMQVWLERAEWIRSQQPKDKDKLYALHAPEVECIGKGKARKLYEFGVKVGIAVTARKGLVVGARSFAGNPYDGDTLGEQLEQVEIVGGQKPKTAIVDLGYRGCEVEGGSVLHRGKPKSLTRRQWAWVKWRQAIEPVIGHLKDDCRLRRCHLKGADGDALHMIACAAGYNIRWLLRWIVFLWAWILVTATPTGSDSSRTTWWGFAVLSALSAARTSCADGCAARRSGLRPKGVSCFMNLQT